VSGVVDIEMGLPTQTQNTYLQSQLGTEIPAFRGVAMAVLNQVYMGNNPYLKPWKFKASRVELTSGGDVQWESGLAGLERVGESSCEAVCDSLDNYLSDTFGVAGLNLDAGITDTAENTALASTLFGFPLAFDGDLSIALSRTTTSTGGASNAITLSGVMDNIIDDCAGNAQRKYAALRISKATNFPWLQIPSGDVVAEGNTITGVKFFKENGTASLSEGGGTVDLYDKRAVTWLSYNNATTSFVATSYLLRMSVDASSKTATFRIECTIGTLTPENRATPGINPVTIIGTIDLDSSSVPFEDWAIMEWSLALGEPTATAGYEVDGAGTLPDLYRDLAVNMVGSICLWHKKDGVYRKDVISDSQTVYVASVSYRLNDLVRKDLVGGYFAPYSTQKSLISYGYYGLAAGIYITGAPVSCDELIAAFLANQDGENCDGCQDMNPAHIIRECLTDNTWGMGYADSDVDDVSFLAAATALKAEGMGISILWEREQPIEDFIGVILSHIDAVLYVSRETGKFVLELIRAKVPTITLDETNVSSVSNASRPTVSELTNSVSVVYWNPASDEDASVTLHNEALRQIQGVEISTTLQYPGFSSRDTASKVAARDLKALSTPLLSCSVTASRAAAPLNVGDVFYLDWPDLNINTTAMRVNEIDYGDGINNAVNITAIQDVFSTPLSSTVATNPEVWIDPTAADPLDAVARVVTETPYYLLVQEIGERDANDILTDDADAGFLLASGGRQGNELNASVYVDTGSGYIDSASMDFHPYALVTADVGITDTVINIDTGKDIDLVTVGGLAQIGNELVRVDSINLDGGGAVESVTVGRGVLDTVPQPHTIASPSDTYIKFIDGFAVSDNEQYTAAEVIDVKIRTAEGSSLLALADATEETVTMDSRAIRPYPPGDLQIDSVSYPELGASPANVWSADHVITWAHRDRLQQTDGNLYDYTDTDIGPEAGTTYRIDVYSTLVDTTESSIWWTDNVGAVNTYTMGSESPAIPSPPVNTASVNIKVTAVRDGYDSWQSPVATLDAP
jgi:hypothetical protein